MTKDRHVVSCSSEEFGRAPQRVMVTRPEDLAACCDDLSKATVIGLDTEFIGEQTFVPQLCLVQIATWDRLYLIDPFSVGSLNDLWPILTDSERTIVCHAAREEIRICQRFCGRLPVGIFDLQIAAGLVGLGYPIGHGPLIAKLLGEKLSKGEALTDWKKRPLTPRQIEYAFDDVRFLLPAWRVLVDRLGQLGRIGWAEEEFEALLTRSLGDEPGVERWRKLKGLGNLNRRELGIVRELFHWREEKAYEKNRPVRAIVRDDLLVEIARRDPRSERDLAVVRGVTRADLSDIVEVLNRVRKLPVEALPELPTRDDDPPHIGLLATFLGIVLQQLCVEWQLSPALVATVNDLKLLVRSLSRNQSLPETASLARGWRSRVVLPELCHLLEGRRLVRVAELGSGRPFQFSEASSPLQADEKGMES